MMSNATVISRIWNSKLAQCVLVLGVILLGLWVPTIVKSTFYLGLFINAIILGIAALSIGFLAHQCGLIMFGAAGFTGGAT